MGSYTKQVQATVCKLEKVLKTDLMNAVKSAPLNSDQFTIVFHWGHQHFLTSNLTQMQEIAYILSYVWLQYINPVVKAHQPSADRCDRLQAGVKSLMCLSPRKPSHEVTIMEHIWRLFRLVQETCSSASGGEPNQTRLQLQWKQPSNESTHLQPAGRFLSGPALHTCDMERRTQNRLCDTTNLIVPISMQRYYNIKWRLVSCRETDYKILTRIIQPSSLSQMLKCFQNPTVLKLKGFSAVEDQD